MTIRVNLSFWLHLNFIDNSKTNYQKLESFEIENPQNRTKRMVRFGKILSFIKS